jgi:prolyl-tRNA synthetase
LRVTIGSRGVKQGKVEIRIRRTGEVIETPIEGAAERVLEVLNEVD